MKAIFKPNLLLITILLSIGQIIYLYPKLPPKVAIHFNSTGYADAYSSKLMVSIFQISIIIILSFSFFIISKYLHKFPDSFLNLANKNYWLAPARKFKSINIVSGELLNIIAYTNLLLIAIFQLISNASINGTYKLSSISLWFLIIYLSLVTIKVVKMYRYFSHPVDANE